jgi:CubicO group peptidase (beta-lactamase class C family)
MPLHAARPIALVAALAAALPLPLGAQAGGRRSPAADAARAARLDSVARAALAAGRAPGLAVAVVHRRDTLLLRGYGYARLADSVAMSPDAVFHVGSITKPFTAAAVMRLVRAGRVRLDDSLRAHLPDYAGPGGGATIGELLAHTSGIPSFTELPAFRAARGRAWAPGEVRAVFEREPLRFAPGTGWAYSNSGYYLLGLVVERAAGAAYADVVRRELASPLGLRVTGACDAGDGRRAVQGYDVEGGRLTPTGPVDASAPFAAGALCSSARELARWTASLAGGRVVGRDGFARMAAPAALRGGGRAAYGLGLEVTELAGHRRVGHGGAVAGEDGYAAHYPDDSLTVVVLANRAGANAEALEKTLARVALGLPPAAVREVALDPAARERYVGVYRAGPGRVTITARGDRLHVEGPVDADLLHVGDHTFVLADEPDVTLVFRLGDPSGAPEAPARGAAQAIAWTSRGRTLVLPRLP